MTPAASSRIISAQRMSPSASVARPNHRAPGTATRDHAEKYSRRLSIEPRRAIGT